MAGALKAISQKDFSGGENLVTTAYDLSEKQSQLVLNMTLDEHGALRTRDGTLVQGVASPDGSAPIIKLYDFIKVSGSLFNLAITSLGAGNKLYLRDVSPWTNKGTFTTNYLIPDAVTFTDRVIFAGGDETIKAWDGTTFAALTGSPPSGRHLAVHLGFLWDWGTGATTTATDGPSSLRSCSLNDPNTWPGANQVFIAKDDGQSAQGLGLFTIAETGISPTATLIAFKDYSAYDVTGVFGASNFAIQKIKSDMGCVAPRTIQFVSGFGLIRLTHKGFALFDGVNDLLISEEIRPLLFGRDNNVGLDWTNVSLSQATQVTNPPLYLCACPLSGPGLTRVFIYDLIRKAWTHTNFPSGLSTLQLITDPGSLPVVLGGDFSAGRVRRYFSGDPNDDATAIPWLMLSRMASAGAPVDRAYFRRLLVKLFNVPSGTVVTATFFFGPASSASTKSQTVTVVTGSSALSGFGLDAYGTTGYGGISGASALTDVDVNFDIGVIANNMAVQLTASGPARLRALEWHVRPKSLTRSALVKV